MNYSIDPRTNNVTFLGLDFITDILWPNFSGTVTDYNQPKGVNPAGRPVGKRSFKIRFTDEALRSSLIDIGYNVRTVEPRKEGDVPYYTLECFLEYKNSRFAPTVFTKLESDEEAPEIYKNESTIDDLDNLDISTINVTVRPYAWEWAGSSGIKAEVERLGAYLRPLPF